MEEEKKSEEPTVAEVVDPVNIENLTFAYDMNKDPNIVGLNCKIEPNSKVILVGANGAGMLTNLLPD
jgi:ABC-type bacteriocin/lantibiotic exporter with double-glycine peptidase domain